MPTASTGRDFFDVSEELEHPGVDYCTDWCQCQLSDHVFVKLTI